MEYSALKNKNFGIWLKGRIKKAGLSSHEVAEKAGIHKVSLSRIINGKIGIRRSNVLALAGILNLDIAEALMMAGYAPGDQELMPAELKGIAFGKLDSYELQEIRGIIELKIEIKERRIEASQEEKAQNGRDIVVSKTFRQKARAKHKNTVSPRR